ncbi:midasin [Rhizophagus clarus]|uniref:Midasin n=1 Tax=Rhizophagus clarus TaxID=94130 RepID=A0A8H3M2K4_9GLOM|nr:midasin [Rhizophagus clarus]
MASKEVMLANNLMDVDTEEKHTIHEIGLYDPLGINMKIACQNLLSKIEQINQQNSSVISKGQIEILNSYIINDNKNEIKNTQKLLDCISDLLLIPSLTLNIANLFRPILIDLVSRWLLSNNNDTMEVDYDVMSKVENVAYAFSLLLPIKPQLLSFAVKFFSQSSSLLERLNFLNQDRSSENFQVTKDLQRLLLTAYRLLRFSGSTFIRLWNWSPLFQLLIHVNKTIRYLTVLCLSIVLNMSDEQRENVIRFWVGADNEMASIEWEDGNTQDIGMLSLLEQVSLAKQQLKLLQNDFINKNSSELFQINESDLSPLTVNVSGVLLPKLFTCSEKSFVSNEQRLVLTDTTKNNLYSICLAISLGSPVLLEGIIGAGKTALVEEIARVTGREHDLVKIHLGDQTDSKVLLGTYVSTSTPASFRWQPGVLTTAVRDGRWVLIEDIDLAPMEVLSILLPLLETRQLFIPSRGEKIDARQGFQLFATKSLLPIDGARRSVHQRVNDSSLGETLWTRIKVNPLNVDELTCVVRNRFVVLQELVPDIINVFNTIISINHDSTFLSNLGRYISTRDLMKWCERMKVLLCSRNNIVITQGITQNVREDLFKEAADCFCSMISDYESWIAILERIGDALQISKEWVHLYVDSYLPEMKFDDKIIFIGRVNLVPSCRKEDIIRPGLQKRPFAVTGHALKLLEQIAVCVHLCEPVLLVGETGTGKTTVVQHLAKIMHQNLVVVNLSQQSDSSDLLGGFKPVDAKILANPLKDEFDKLFEKTFSIRRNVRFLETVRKIYTARKFDKFVSLMKQAIKMAGQKFNEDYDHDMDDQDSNSSQKHSSRKSSNPELRNRWKIFENAIIEFESQLDQIRNKFVFSFVEGSLVKAVTKGDWILLDEINLASTETLECLSGLLQDSQGSLLLTEKGDIEPVKRHPNFRVFACMNPATDVGKRDLPPGLRNRFTEFFVYSPDKRRDDLLTIVKQYLSDCVHGDERACTDIVEFYIAVKELQQQHLIADGANQRLHFSMRTLTRALSYVVQITPSYGLRRSMYEGFCMTFLTQSNKESEILLKGLVEKFLLNGVKNPKNLITQIPKQPLEGNYIQFGYFWLELGDFPENMPHYILTPSVKKNLDNLSRVVMSGKYPVLIQGPTSAGKTSMIQYLAKRTGHRFVRINNHEHTDIQEYLGTYVTNSEGKLEFQEGVLVEALKKGYWVVLDELNLAPTDVLEALNRLLDDNRELLIPETQEIVKPHKGFMLFATQNPPGLYGGRKVLSRAFRNRFLELHFDDIPEDELEVILSERCKIAPSYCKRLVQVYKHLMERRQGTRIFEQKHGYITLRDLFRWAERGAIGYQELAEQGYMLLAERIRKPDEKLIVKQVLESVMKVTIDEQKMYDCSNMDEFKKYISLRHDKLDIVWTKAMKRLFTLVTQCLKFNEPILLIGETGCGKTTVCQMLAEVEEKELHIVNCHHSTETADLLGGQRPLRNKGNLNNDLIRDLIDFLRKYAPQENICLEEIDLSQLITLFQNFCKDEKWNKAPTVSNENVTSLVTSLRSRCKQARTLFEWHDGSLVQAMKNGDFFLLDEISLADDSVIERLNSVLEPSRTLVLAEKGGKHVEELVAKDGFQFLATMNPGGDYGKKELSPALRNRFTEIWVPSVTDHEDLLQIIENQFSHDSLAGYGHKILDFIEWFSHSLNNNRTIISLRDILSWVLFMNSTVEQLGPHESFINGGSLVFLDGLGSNAASGSLLSGQVLKEFRMKCLAKLSELKGDPKQDNFFSQSFTNENEKIHYTESLFGIYPFYIPKGTFGNCQITFTLQAPTTLDNAMRILRAMQLKKPILLEGSPGVGKTSLVTALAAASGHKLIRINLSEQTDLMDLFGSDLPVEGGSNCEFAWRDAPFLQAMKSGDWVLLDELNLASQSVLEGLNSCLDHRGAVYIPELNKEFYCSSEFRVFGAQNPIHQGGGRKGLPRSFINRFTQVYIEQLTKADMLFIAKCLFPQIENLLLEKIIEFNNRMYEETMIECLFGRKGTPWEFNLRDVFRWLELLANDKGFGFNSIPDQYLDLIYLQRMRTVEDRIHVINLFNEIFDKNYQQPKNPYYHINSHYIQIGHSLIRRQSTCGYRYIENSLHILHSQLRPLESIMKCVEFNWMVILTGHEATGKTSLVRLLANLTGNHLEEFAMNNSVDTIELLGGFEQVDVARHRQIVIDELRRLSIEMTKKVLIVSHSNNLFEDNDALHVLKKLNDIFFTLENHIKFSTQNSTTSQSSYQLDYSVVDQLLNILQQIMTKFNLCPLFDNEISNLLDNITTLKSLESGPITGRFEWIDGVLINALQNGHWLLIDNANLCNPSVLDRLNSLIEPNGVLMINERGLIDGDVKVIQPHKNFRLFMTTDPRNGELSRSMRNRGVEIALLKTELFENQQDIVKIGNGLGLRVSELLSSMNSSQFSTEENSCMLSLRQNMREFILFSRFIIEMLQRGEGLLQALHKAFRQIYIVNCVPNEMMKYLQDFTKKYNIVNNENLICNLSSTNCPVFNGGIFIKEEARLSMVHLQGSYLIYLLFKYGFSKLNHNDLSFSSLQELFVSCDYFIENTSLDDVSLRNRWLSFVSYLIQSFNLVGIQKINILEYIKFMNDTLSCHPLVSHLNEIKIQLAKLIDLDLFYVLSQPLDVTSNYPLVMLVSRFDNKKYDSDKNETIYNLWNQYSLKIKVFTLMKRLQRQDYIENLSYEKATREKVSKLTLSQQSYCYHHGRISDNQLSHLVVANFFPFLQEFKNFVRFWINQGNYDESDVVLFNNLLDYHVFLWEFLQQNLLDLGELYVCTKMIKEALKHLIDKFKGHGKNLLNICDGITEDTVLTTGKFMSILWKQFHHISLSRIDLFKLKKELSEVNFNKNVEHQDNKKIQIQKIDVELKVMLIDAVATLYFIDENQNSESTDELLISLRKIPEYIQKYLRSSQEPTTQIKPLPLIDYFNLIREMQIISQLQLAASQETDLNNENYRVILNQISEFRDFALKNCSWSPLDFVPHQQLLWIYGPGSKVPDDKARVIFNNILQDIIYGWHNKLWNNSFNNLYISEENLGANKFVENTAGPGRVFQSVLSFYYFNYTHRIQSISVGSFDTELAQLVEYGKHVGNDLLLLYKINRKCLDFICLIQQIKLIFIPLKERVSQENFRTINEKLDTVINVVNSLLNNDVMKSESSSPSIAIESLYVVSSGLKEIVDPALRSVLDRWIVPSILLLIQILEGYNSLQSNEDVYQKIGKIWVFLSLSFISLYIPNYPLDPTAEARSKCHFLQLKQSSLEVEIDIRTKIEQSFTGECDNCKIEDCKKSLDDVKLLLRRASVNLSLRPERSQLNELFKHIHYICNNVIDEQHIFGLLNDFENENDLAVLQRENLFQEKIIQFIQRMTSNYPLYQDLLQPLYVSLFQIKYGVRIIASSYKNLVSTRDKLVYNVIKSLVNITNLGCSKKCIEVITAQESYVIIKGLIFSQQSRPDKWDQYLKYLVVVLYCIYYHISKRGNIILEDLVSIQRIFGEITDIYAAAEEQKNKIARENESLYRNKTKTYNEINEEQYSEYEFRQMFPDFNHEFADISDDIEINSNKNFTQFEENISILNEEILFEIGKLYTKLVTDFRLNSPRKVSNCEMPTKEVFWKSFVMARDLSLFAGKILPEEFDEAIVTSQILGTSLLKKWFIDGIEPGDDTCNIIKNIDLKMYDFYKDQNIIEAKKLVPVISDLQKRVKELLEMWPEHAILQQIDKICDRIQGFTLNSPIAKFLTGLEILLQKTEDWEVYANRDVSVKLHKDKITDLIVQWRQLELTCWPNLLTAQDNYHERTAYKWWFHLYNCIVHPIDLLCIKVVTNERIDQNSKDHISEIVRTLDQFLQSSKIGDFKARLDLIHAFYVYLCMKDYFHLRNTRDRSTEFTHASLYSKTADALLNVYKYYSQFLDRNSNTLRELRKPIEKDLKQFVKIASWKDVNIHALKQSAQKTHRQLNKCIRKYKDILNKPIVDIITDYQINNVTMIHSREKDVIEQAMTLGKWISNCEPVVPTERILKLQNSLNKQVFPVPERFLNIRNTLKKLRSYCQQDILTKIYSTYDRALDNFATEIILRIKKLQEETPDLMNEENKNIVKNLKLIKKKSMVDLLRELKRLGLCYFPNKNIIEQQQNIVEYVLQLPRVELQNSLPMISDFEILKDPLSVKDDIRETISTWKKADEYYYKIIARMIHLRNIAASHSKDLTSQEVQKGLGFSEDLLYLLIKERQNIQALDKQYVKLLGVLIQFSMIYSSYNAQYSYTKACEYLSFFSIDERTIWNFKEVLDDLNSLLFHSCVIFDIQKQYEQSNYLSHFEEIGTKLHDWFDKISSIRNDFVRSFDREILFPEYAIGEKALISKDIINLVKDNMMLIDGLYQFARDYSSRIKCFSHILAPICDYIKNRIGNLYFNETVHNEMNLNSQTTTILENVAKKVNDLIDAVLVAIQDLQKSSTEPTKDTSNLLLVNIKDEEIDDNIPDGHIRQEHERVLNLGKHLRISLILERFVTLHKQLINLTDDERFNNMDCQDLISNLLQRVFPFIQQYYLVVQYYLNSFIYHHKSLCKLTYVLCNSFATIFMKGYCMPQMESDDGEIGDEENAQGTGIGEGEGNKDVSEEIEDEEQVLGNQNEEKDKDSANDQLKLNKDKGIEMENDFEGTIEDVEDDENRDESDDETSENIEQEMGQFDDNDPDAVDEKMWEDDSVDDIEDSRKTTNMEQESGVQGETDIVAKEDQGTTTQDSQEKNRENDVGDNQQEPMETEYQSEDDDNINEGYNDIDKSDLNVDIPQAETLELPEDMMIDDIEGNTSDQDEEINNDDLSSNMDIDESEVQAKDTTDNIQDGFNEEAYDAMETDEIDDLRNDDSISNETKDENKTGTEKIENIDEISDENQQESSEGEIPKERPNHKIQLSTDDNQLEDMNIEKNDQKTSPNQEQPNSDAPTENLFGVDGEDGKENMTSSKTSGNGFEQSLQEIENQEFNNNNNSQQIKSKGESNSNNTDEFKKSENTIEDQSKDQSTKDVNPHRSLGDALKQWKRRLDNIVKGSEDTSEQENNLEQNQIIKEDQTFEFLENNEESHDLQTMGAAAEDQIGAIDNDEQYYNYETNYTAEENEVDYDKSQKDEMTDVLSMNDYNHNNEDEKGAILSRKIIKQDDEHQLFDEKLDPQSIHSSRFTHEPLTREEIESLRQELEIKLTDWRQSGRDITKARELWQKYENLTYDLANGLCEQLRLILEPTLATKLKGDYRTGKRLNMKKIIPYIASDFKKDKIWLRRTKPSKRQYQVMIAVDDSKSILNSEAGAQVLQQFTFEQNKTYVRSLMETSITLLEHAKNCSTQNKELWQLQLIISDGVCEDHESIKTLVRRAVEARIMVVFIIVDNKPGRDSIMSMNHVKYKSINGRMTIHMERYLDTFPFDYYVVLRDINALSETLADALRQYFSIISQNSE